uniref:Uncharacterized protein n=1 Tax=Anopheles melas TaxID=34690 RepID=A0A182UE56_9DIPT
MSGSTKLSIWSVRDSTRAFTSTAMPAYAARLTVSCTKPTWYSVPMASACSSTEATVPSTDLFVLAGKAITKHYWQCRAERYPSSSSSSSSLPCHLCRPKWYPATLAAVSPIPIDSTPAERVSICSPPELVKSHGAGWSQSGSEHPTSR